MLKKIVCLIMILAMLSGVASIGVSAETDEKLYFLVPSDWHNYWKIFCHIYPYGGEPLANWMSKKEVCEDEGNGIWSYDPSKVGGLSDDVTYCVIFAADTGVQTYDAVMTTECYGDTLYCDGTKFENLEDPNKTALAARWKNNTDYGPVRAITSIGNVVGETYVVEPAEMFEEFLTEKLSNAQWYSGKDDQQLLDDTAGALGLGKNTVESLIMKTGTVTSWSKALSVLPEQDSGTTQPEEYYILGDVDHNLKVNVKDATAIQKYVAQIEVLDGYNRICADADKNLKITVKDATAVQKFVAGISNPTGIGERIYI